VGAHKYPREVVIVPVVPFTPVGKVDRKALRAMLEGTQSQEASAQ
jgi:acyl-CoA synthetase (AMP-forming)/AMP-acid ligase II